MCAQLGVEGVVLGVLTQNGDVDATQLAEFRALCDSQAWRACWPACMPQLGESCQH